MAKELQSSFIRRNRIEIIETLRKWIMFTWFSQISFATSYSNYSLFAN